MREQVSDALTRVVASFGNKLTPNALPEVAHVLRSGAFATSVADLTACTEALMSMLARHPFQDREANILLGSFLLETARFLERTAARLRAAPLESSILTVLRLSGNVRDDQVRDLTAASAARAWAQAASSGAKTYAGGLFRPHMPRAARPAILVVGQIRSMAVSSERIKILGEQWNADVFVVAWNRSGFRMPTPESGTVFHLSRVLPQTVVDEFARLEDGGASLIPRLVCFRELFEAPLDPALIARTFAATKILLVDELAFEAKWKPHIDLMWARDPVYTQHSTPLNSAKMVFLNHSAIRFIESIEIERSTVYSNILRIRPDAVIDPARFELSSLIDDAGVGLVVDLPKEMNSPLVGDSLSFGSSSAQRAYCELWREWLDIQEGFGAVSALTQPHLRITDHLLAKNIPITPVQGLLTHYDSSPLDSKVVAEALESDLYSAVPSADEARTLRESIKLLRNPQ